MKPKSTFLLIISLTLITGILCYSTPQAKSDSFNNVKTFESLNYDGHILSVASSYLDARNSESGTSVWDTNYFICGGQIYNNEKYYIYRGFLFFDTSPIPDTATITSVKLSIKVFSDDSATDFNLTIQNGQPTYPHTPLQDSDFYYIRYQGNGGQLDTSTITAGQWYNITFTSEALNWINKEGITKLCLRSSRDINSIPPTGNEAISIYSSESDYPPKLYVEYSYEGAEYIFYGPFNEETGLKDGNITITVYPAYGTPFNFTLDGTYTIELENIPLMFKWKLDFNYSRVYVPLYSYEVIYIFKPTDPYFYYQVEIIDLAGLHNIHLESLVNINGTLRIAERRQISTGGTASFVFTEFKTYNFRLKADEGIIELGTRTIPERPIWTTESITFVVSPAQIPKDYAEYEGLTVSATRINSTHIQVIYQDSNNRTNSISITIYMIKDKNQLVEEYSANYQSQSITLNWYDAIPSKHYLVQVTVNHAEYGTLTWKIPCKSTDSPSRLSINWNSLLGWLGDWPITPSNFISMAFIFTVITLGSFKDSAFALLLGGITAGILIYLGWYSMSWATLTLIISLTIALAIAKGKVKLIER